jgi:taurine dioxygenase
MNPRHAVSPHRCGQHHARWDYYDLNRRYGHRVTICGDKPYYDIG